jgi:hypothetical protein
MNRILKPVLAALLLAAAPAFSALTAPPAVAQAADPAASQVENFYDALTAAMKAGGTPKSRYDRLKPAVV